MGSRSYNMMLLTPIIFFFLCCGSTSALSPSIKKGILASGRIFHGDFHYWTVPYQAMLVRKGRFTCGGTIISNNFVLTAAHCVDANKITEYSVAVGYHSPHKTFFNVSEILVHESYNPKDPTHLAYDIALLKLSGKIKFVHPSISQACLPADVNDLYDGKKAVVSGWGETERLYLSPYLMKKTVRILSPKDKLCKHNVYDHKKQICATAIKYRRDAGSGDSGGPLVVKDNGKNIVVGIVSHSKLENCEKVWYGETWSWQCTFVIDVYTRVTGYLEWIKERVGSGTC